MSGIYIHIPFCKQACTYCNFHFSTQLDSVASMVNAIVKEITLRKSEVKTPISTIYLGGGTPGMLAIEDLEKIVNAIKSNFDISQLQELTIEVNPDDMHLEKLQALYQLGCDRLSVGTQSFYKEDLIFMNRSHDEYAASNCIQLAQSIGFKNISLDLIYGYPLLTDEKWRANLQRALSLGVTHISSYALTVEPKTALAHQIQHNKTKPLSNEQAARQFDMLMNWAADHQIQHYEISNFAFGENFAIHNTNYWKGKPYLGIGPSAHSYDGHLIRQWNVAHNAKYISSINDNILPLTQEQLTPQDVINEMIMLGLRTQWGVEKENLRHKMSSDQWNTTLSYITQHQDLFKSSETHFVLNSAGKLLADGIASNLFVS